MKLLFYKLLIVTLLCGFTCQSQEAQETPQEDTFKFWDRVRFGGGVGLSFGNGFFSGTLAPSAVYQFNDQFALGAGLTGTYNSQRDISTSTIIGGSVITLYNIISEIQLSAEFEQLNIDQNFDEVTGLTNRNFWNTALFLGAGYSNGNITMGIRYDVLYNEDKSIYADPWVPFIRVFF